MHKVCPLVKSSLIPPASFPVPVFPINFRSSLPVHIPPQSVVQTVCSWPRVLRVVCCPRKGVKTVPQNCWPVPGLLLRPYKPDFLALPPSLYIFLSRHNYTFCRQWSLCSFMWRVPDVPCFLCHGNTQWALLTYLNLGLIIFLDLL